VAIGWSFVGAGTVAICAGDNRTGLLMSVAGLVWLAATSIGEVTRHVDAVAGNMFVAVLAHLCCVSDGRARTPRQRWLVVAPTCSRPPGT
jgi:hypothetical protein